MIALMVFYTVYFFPKLERLKKTALNNTRCQLDARMNMSSTIQALNNKQLDVHDTLNNNIAFKIELHNNAETIADEWKALQSNAITTLFQTHEWVSAWCRHTAMRFGETPVIITGRDRAGHLAFILPMAIVRKFGLSMLTWLGQGHACYGFGIYRRDIIKQLDAKKIHEILVQVTNAQPDISALYLVKQPLQWEGYNNPFSALPHYPFPVEVVAFDLNTNFNKLMQETFSSRNLRRTEKKKQKLEKLGAVEFVITHTPENRKKIFEVFREQKNEQLSQMGLKNIYSEAAIQSFYTDFLTKTEQDIKIQLCYLSVGEDIAATDIVIVFNKRCYSINGSITSGPLDRFSPGIILLREIVKLECELGCTVYDIGPGGADYKKEWPCYQIPLFATMISLQTKATPVVALMTSRIRAIAFVKSKPKLWSALNQMRDRIRNTKARLTND